MADVFYGITRGEKTVTRDTSSPTKEVEVVVDDAVGSEKKDVVLALEKIIEAVLEDGAFNNV